MKSSSTYLTILMIVLLGLAGYYYLDQVSPMQDDLEDMQRRVQELQFEVAQLKEQNSELRQQLEQKVEEISKEKEKEISQLKTTYDDLISGLEEQVEKGEVTITRLADELKVNIVDRILFPSGHAGITDEGKQVLTQVGNVLKESEGKRIRVEGHTDDVPIHPNLQEEFPTNWELSVARATNVVRFLHEKVALEPQRLEAAGYAEYRPIATNKTKRGRAQNRRIEIVLLPMKKDIEALTTN